MKIGVMSVIGLLALILLNMEPSHAITCGEVNTNLGPCTAFLRNGGSPTRACCNGVRAINNMTPTTPDRRAACECIKQAASKIQDFKDDAAARLPGLCGVSVGVRITKNINCNNVPE